MPISSRSANETKASKMEGWEGFPLKEPRDLETWWDDVVDKDGKLQDSKKWKLF